MVSELSARLLRGYSITYKTSSPVGSMKRFSDFSSASSSASGSYGSEHGSKRTVDDLEQITERTEIDDRLRTRDACFKRRKIDDLRFAASMVKEDLEKGGLPFPSIHEKKPRALEGYDIDMSNIRLLGAKSVADSPFLGPTRGYNISETTTCEFDQLFIATQRIYSNQWIQGDGLDWDKSSAGSLTSDSEEASCAVDIPPLLEDAIMYRSTSANKNPVSTAPIETVPMKVALENCSEPRLVTLSFAPFLIIHVNAAYTRVTGIAAKDILGKQFRDVFKDKRCKSMATNVSSISCMNDQLTSVSTIRQDKRCHCRLKVSFVGPEGGLEKDCDDASIQATHCMVALQPTNTEDETNLSAPIVPSTPGGSFEVMG